MASIAQCDLNNPHGTHTWQVQALDAPLGWHFHVCHGLNGPTEYELERQEYLSRQILASDAPILSECGNCGKPIQSLASRWGATKRTILVWVHVDPADDNRSHRAIGPHVEIVTSSERADDGIQS